MNLQIKLHACLVEKDVKNATLLPISVINVQSLLRIIMMVLADVQDLTLSLKTLEGSSVNLALLHVFNVKALQATVQTVSKVLNSKTINVPALQQPIFLLMELDASNVQVAATPAKVLLVMSVEMDFC